MTNSLDDLKKFIEKEKGESFDRIMMDPLPITQFEANVEIFFEQQPFFYDKSEIFWFWNKEENCWKIVDTTDIMIELSKRIKLSGETIASQIKNNYLEAFRRVGRRRMPKEAKKTWVQFKDIIVDIETNKRFPATPEYFMCNPIPWSIGDSDETPTIDSLFSEWVGEEYVPVLYEILAYSCLADYPIHLIFCLVGGGRNGKTQFQRLMTRFIGKPNICTTELGTLMSNRFESFKLFKKLVCQMGETEFNVMNKTSLLKKLSGGDLVSFECKQKIPFDEFNYAKILINSNSLPISEDTSEGFYRRWLIIDFPNEFPEGKDVLTRVPDVEFSNLAAKVIKILPPLLEMGKFTLQGSIDERRYRYLISSNPIKVFLDLCLVKEPSAYCKANDLYNLYCEFLRRTKSRVIKRKEFYSALAEQGYHSVRTSRKTDSESSTGNVGYVYYSTNWVDGLQIRPKIMYFMRFMSRSLLNSLYREISSTTPHNLHNLHNLFLSLIEGKKNSKKEGKCRLCSLKTEQLKLGLCEFCDEQ